MAAAQPDQVQWLDVQLSNYDYPFSGRHFPLTTQQQTLEMYYMDVTATAVPPNGETVVLLHGKNFNGAYWEQTANSLLERGYRVIMPDQIGFGKSSKPQHYHYSFHQLAQNTKALLDHLQVEQAVVLGHSMGGMLATRFALMYPEMVQQLVLANPIGLEDWTTKVPYRSVAWWYERELKKDYQSIRAYQQQSYYDGEWRSSYDPWVNLLAGWTRNSNYPTIAWNAALTYDMIFTQPVVYEFPNLTMPTLLIIGTRDRTALGKPLVSEAVRATLGRYDQLGKRTQKAIPNAQLIELPGIGHLPHIEAFEEFINPLLVFLEQQ